MDRIESRWKLNLMVRWTCFFFVKCFRKEKFPLKLQKLWIAFLPGTSHARNRGSPRKKKHKRNGETPRCGRDSWGVQIISDGLCRFTPWRWVEKKHGFWSLRNCVNFWSMAAKGRFGMGSHQRIWLNSIWIKLIWLLKDENVGVERQDGLPKKNQGESACVFHDPKIRMETWWNNAFFYRCLDVQKVYSWHRTNAKMQRSELWKCWAKSAARGTLICLIKGLSVHMTHHDASFYSCIYASFFVLHTPLKFNMEPENGPLEKEIPFGKTHHAEILEYTFTRSF